MIPIYKGFLVLIFIIFHSDLATSQSLLEYSIEKMENDVIEVKEYLYGDIEIKADGLPNLSKDPITEILKQYAYGLPIREVVIRDPFEPNVGNETVYYYNPDKTLSRIDLIEVITPEKKRVWKTHKLEYSKGKLFTESVFYGSEFRGKHIYTYSQNKQGNDIVDITLQKPSDPSLNGKFHIEFDSLGTIVYSTKSAKGIVGEVFKVIRYDSLYNEYTISSTFRGKGEKLYTSQIKENIKRDKKGNVIGKFFQAVTENPQSDEVSTFSGYLQNKIEYGKRKESDLKRLNNFIKVEELENRNEEEKNEIYIPSFDMTPKENEPHRIVEDMPRFPGCEETDMSDMEKEKCSRQKLKAYVASHLKYPASAKNDGYEGKCYVQFVVNKDGKISDIKIQRSRREDLDREAIRIFSEMNKNGIVWRAGKQRGRNVRVYYSAFVEFKL